MNTLIISAFPACGKTRFFVDNQHDIKILDSDSSTFDKTDFPANYIDHIKSNIGKVDIIMISSHEDVRKELSKNEIIFTLIYPMKDCRDEWRSRMMKRGSSFESTEMIQDNWVLFLDSCNSQKGCIHLILNKGQFLSSVIKL